MWKKHGKGGDHLCTAESSKKKKNHKNKLDGQNSKSYKLKMRTKTFLNNNTYPSSFAFSTCSCPFPNNVHLQNSVSVQKRLAIAGITFCFKKRNSCYYASKPHFLQFQAPLPKETPYYNILQKSAVLNVWCKSSQFSVLLNRSNNPFQDFQISFQITPVSSRRQRIICNFAWKKSISKNWFYQIITRKEVICINISFHSFRTTSIMRHQYPID